MAETRHIVTREAREICEGDVIVWRGQYLPIEQIGRIEVGGGDYILLFPGNPVRGSVAMRPASIFVMPGELVIRWERYRPPQAE